MKKVKNTKIAISITIFLIIASISSFCNAGVEIKSGTTPYTSVNISESFDICYNLRDGTSTLGNCDLDPHMATSLDWGAVAYLAQSRYGANSSNVTTNTTGNKTGIMDLGSYTQTATILENRSTSNTYLKSLEEALKDENKKKYVDVIPTTFDNTTTKGRAMTETRNWYGANTSWTSLSANYPVVIRDSLFGVNNVYVSILAAGQAHTAASFRPVIWN